MNNDAYEEVLDILLDEGAKEADRRIGEGLTETEEDISFSAEHMKKMKTLFSAERRKIKRKKLKKYARTAACMAAAAVIVSGITIYNVDALKVRFMNFVHEIGKPNSDISFLDNGGMPYSDNNITFDYVPMGFEMVENIESKPISNSWFFESNDQYFVVATSIMEGTMSIDTENALVENISINGLEGICSLKETVTILVWHDNQTVFTIYGDIPKEEIVKIAENLKLR